MTEDGSQNPDVNHDGGDNNNTDEGNGGGSWVDNINEDLRSHVEGFDDPNKLVSEYASLKERVPVVPEEADKYEVHMPEGVAVTEKGKTQFDTFVGQLRTFAKEQNLTQGQFDAILNAEIQRANAYDKGLAAQFEKNQKALKEEWKDSYDTNLKKAESIYNKVFDEKDRKYFESKGLHNDPGFVRAMFRLHDSMGEDSFDGGRSDHVGPRRDPETGLPMINFPSMKKKG